MTTTHTIAGQTITISEAVSFGRPDAARPAKYQFIVEDSPYWARNDDRTYRTAEEALAAAARFVGAN